MVWSNSKNSYSEMFQKKLFLSFRGNMHGRDQSYPGAQLAAWSVAKVKLYQRYFSATYLKLLTTSGTIAISCPLTYHVYCAVILYLIFSELFTKRCFLCQFQKFAKLQKKKKKRGGIFFMEKLLAYSIQICWSGTPRWVSSLE